MGIGFTLETLKALNSFDINCFVLKVSKHWVSVLSYNYVWPRGPALFATLGVPNAAGFPETCRRASSHACYSTVTPICSVADLSRSNPNKPVFQDSSLHAPIHHIWVGTMQKQVTGLLLRIGLVLLAFHIHWILVQLLIECPELTLLHF